MSKVVELSVLQFRYFLLDNFRVPGGLVERVSSVAWFIALEDWVMPGRQILPTPGPDGTELDEDDYEEATGRKAWSPSQPYQRRAGLNPPTN